MTRHVAIFPRDQIVARDGRPFGGGQANRMKSLEWPYPSVLAGSLRTLLGKSKGGPFDEKRVGELKAVEVAGPFPEISGKLFFPAPRDLIVWENPNDHHRRLATALRPKILREGEGSDMPHGLLPVGVRVDVKPSEAPAFWSFDRMTDWLLDSPPAEIPHRPPRGKNIPGFLYSFDREERTHVAIDRASGTAGEGLLFITMGIDLSTTTDREIALSARVGNAGVFQGDMEKLDTIHPFGGERRLAHWKDAPKAPEGWVCPPRLRQKLSEPSVGIQGLRLVLATPALFQDGWKPAWLDGNNEGTPPGAPKGDTRLKLIGCCIERWRPISGWNLEKGKTGPKPARRIVPAGSVYFFECLKGKISELARDLWLLSVCDDPQDRRDGFGLGLWGIWNIDQVSHGG